MNFLTRFLLAFSISLLVIHFLFPQAPQKISTITFQTPSQYRIGDLVKLEIKNNTDEKVDFEGFCPNLPFGIERNIGGQKENITTKFSLKDCKNVSVEKNSVLVFSFSGINIDLFGKEGDYKILGKTKNGKEFESTFSVYSPGFFGSIWLGLYKVIYNFLILLLTYSPFYNLSLAIIFFTIIIKLILLIPNHQALKNQKDVQRVQPEIAKIKEKYKGDQQKIAMETMNVWKKHKVNPFGSCLPMLVQFPILIAMFFIIKDELTRDSAYLLYSFFANFDYISINFSFFEIMDLHEASIVLGIIVGITQYYQMHISVKITDDKDIDKSDMMAIQMNMMNKYMKYFVPFLAGSATMTFPSAIGLYWLISTLFAIGQQFYVNNLFDKKYALEKNIEIDGVEVLNKEKNTQGIQTKDGIKKIKI